MKKILVIVVVLVLVAVVAYGIFYVMTHDFGTRNVVDKENSELNNNQIEVTKDDKISLISTRQDDGNFVQKYKIIINGIEKELELTFIYDDDKDELTQSLSASFKDNLLFYYWESYGVDGEINEDIYKNGEPYDTNMINNNFNESNFSFIKGEDDKNYLIIVSSIGESVAGREEKLFVLDENFDFVNNNLVDYAGNAETDGMTIMSTYTSYVLDNNAYPWYTDNFKICGNLTECYINVKIDSHKIYYLVPVYENNKLINLQERVYTINDAKFEYEVLNDFAIKNVYGQSN